MKLFVCLTLFTTALAWPQRVVEPYYEANEPTAFENDYQDVMDLEPGFIDGPIVQNGEGFEERGPGFREPSDDQSVPAYVVIDEPMGVNVDGPVAEGPYGENTRDNGVRQIIIRRKQFNPFSFSFGSPMGGSVRRTQRPSMFDIFDGPRFGGDRPMFDMTHMFPSFHNRRPERPSFDLGDIFRHPIFTGFPQESPREEIPEDVPQGPADQSPVYDEVEGNPDYDSGFDLFNPRPQPTPEEDRHNRNPFQHIFKGLSQHPFFQHFNFGSANFGGFPENLPEDYNNSTYKIKDVNGVKMAVNETIHKKSGDGFNTFYHVKVIQRVPDEPKVPRSEFTPEDVPHHTYDPTPEDEYTPTNGGAAPEFPQYDTYDSTPEDEFIPTNGGAAPEFPQYDTDDYTPEDEFRTTNDGSAPEKVPQFDRPTYDPTSEDEIITTNSGAAPEVPHIDTHNPTPEDEKIPTNGGAAPEEVPVDTGFVDNETAAHESVTEEESVPTTEAVASEEEFSYGNFDFANVNDSENALFKRRV